MHIRLFICVIVCEVKYYFLLTIEGKKGHRSKVITFFFYPLPLHFHDLFGYRDASYNFVPKHHNLTVNTISCSISLIFILINCNTLSFIHYFL